MAKFQISNRLSGLRLGTYEAEDESGALEAMARQAGYASYADACAVAPATADELLVERIDGGRSWKRLGAYRAP